MNNKKNTLAEAMNKKTKPVTAGVSKRIISTGEGDKKPLFIRLDPAAKAQLGILKIEQGASSVQALMQEAINDLFLKYDKEPIA